MLVRVQVLVLALVQELVLAQALVLALVAMVLALEPMRIRMLHLRKLRL